MYAFLSLDEVPDVPVANRAPTSYKEAISAPDKHKWILAMKEELNSLHIHYTYKLAELLKRWHTVGCKWVYTLKRDSEEKVIRHKAQLVAQGFTQKKRLDFHKTFTPVA